jgi:hypothetical protein
MTEKKPKKVKFYPKNSQPYKRRTKEEKINILSQILNGSVSKRTACFKMALIGIHSAYSY